MLFCLSWLELILSCGGNGIFKLSEKVRPKVEVDSFKKTQSGEDDEKTKIFC